MNFEKACSRRNFFSTLARQAGEFAVGLVDGAAQASRAFQAEAAPVPAAPPVAWVRPPGALPEADFLSACTRCDDCIKACPHLVIRKAGIEVGKDVATTPIIVPETILADFATDSLASRPARAEPYGFRIRT